MSRSALCIGAAMASAMKSATRRNAITIGLIVRFNLPSSALLLFRATVANRTRAVVGVHRQWHAIHRRPLPPPLAAPTAPAQHATQSLSRSVLTEHCFITAVPVLLPITTSHNWCLPTILKMAVRPDPFGKQVRVTWSIGRVAWTWEAWT